VELEVQILSISDIMFIEKLTQNIYINVICSLAICSLGLALLASAFKTSVLMTLAATLILLDIPVIIFAIFKNFKLR